MRTRRKYNGIYYKIQKLSIFNDVEDNFNGYIHLLRLTKPSFGNKRAIGEVVINGKYYKNAWIDKFCLGEQITREEWENACYVAKGK